MEISYLTVKANFGGFVFKQDLEHITRNVLRFQDARVGYFADEEQQGHYKPNNQEGNG